MKKNSLLLRSLIVFSLVSANVNFELKGELFPDESLEVFDKLVLESIPPFEDLDFSEAEKKDIARKVLSLAVLIPPCLGAHLFVCTKQAYQIACEVSSNVRMGPVLKLEQKPNPLEDISLKANTHEEAWKEAEEIGLRGIFDTFLNASLASPFAPFSLEIDLPLSSESKLTCYIRSSSCGAKLMKTVITFLDHYRKIFGEQVETGHEEKNVDLSKVSRILAAAHKQIVNIDPYVGLELDEDGSNKILGKFIYEVVIDVMQEQNVGTLKNPSKNNWIKYFCYSISRLAIETWFACFRDLTNNVLKLNKFNSDDDMKFSKIFAVTAAKYNILSKRWITRISSKFFDGDYPMSGCLDYIQPTQYLLEAFSATMYGEDETPSCELTWLKRDATDQSFDF